jgi:hypothetical protein
MKAALHPSHLCPALPFPPLHFFPSQNVTSQAPQSLPAISQPPQSGTMGYMGSQSVSMGYQPYNLQVRRPGAPPLVLTTALPFLDPLVVTF